MRAALLWGMGGFHGVHVWSTGYAVYSAGPEPTHSCGWAPLRRVWSFRGPCSCVFLPTWSPMTPAKNWPQARTGRPLEPPVIPPYHCIASSGASTFPSHRNIPPLRVPVPSLTPNRRALSSVPDRALCPRQSAGIEYSPLPSYFPPLEPRYRAVYTSLNPITMQAPGPSRPMQRRSPGAEPGPPPNIPIRSISPAPGMQPRGSGNSARSSQGGSTGPRKPNVSWSHLSGATPFAGARQPHLKHHIFP